MNTPQLNQKVKHVADDTRVGVVTAICTRASGTQYAVTWSDLAERWHAMAELEPYAEPPKPIGFGAE